MRYINIDLSSDNHLQQLQIFGGYAGEHNETVLQVTLPQRMIGIEYSDYRFDFQTSEDNEIPVPVSKLINGVLSCHLTEQLTVAGKLLFNVVARKLDGKVVSLTSKTNMVNLYIGDSPDGNSVLPDPTGYKDEMLKIIDAQITEALKDIQSGEGGTIIVDQTYNPESENAQSGVALNPILQNKIEFWKPNTEYKVGDTVLAIYTVTAFAGGTRAIIKYLGIVVCKENHLSKDIDKEQSYWNIEHIIGSNDANKAYLDSKGNSIVDTYATKTEVGNIETALDRIITIQNSLIGGGNV